MNMYFKILLIAITVTTTPLLVSECPSVNNLGAQYKITTEKTDGKAALTRSFYLWRQGKQVAHVYPHAKISEIWEQARNGKLRMVRHFDEYQRAIEYQPQDLNKGKGIKDWWLKYQLISNNLIQRMQFEGRIGQGCSMIEKYRLDDPVSNIHLQWLPASRLIKHLTVRKKDVVLQWSLDQTFNDEKRIKQLFEKLSAYQTTDYIDIGDNESDPFLLKMMNLGFTEHGSSWVYETRDDAQGHHGHHH